MADDPRELAREQESRSAAAHGEGDRGGQRSTATGESQPPDPVIEGEGSDAPARGGQRDGVRADTAAVGSESTANTSPEGGTPQRKPNA